MGGGEGFLEDLPDQIRQLKECVAVGDTRQVQQHAHKLKGASATAGGEALRAVASGLEQAGKAGDFYRFCRFVPIFVCIRLPYRRACLRAQRLFCGCARATLRAEVGQPLDYRQGLMDSALSLVLLLIPGGAT